MNNEKPNDSKFLEEFSHARDTYWLIDYMSYPALTHFLNEYMDNPDTKRKYNSRYESQSEYGIKNRLDWLINQFMNELIVKKFKLRITGRSSYERKIINQLKLRLN
tara:strand:+ start:10376 stop:10693 length:318 start_codon:yes stop_codon:yes gene_type:complete